FEDAGFFWEITYVGGDGNDVVVTAVARVVTGTQVDVRAGGLFVEDLTTGIDDQLRIVEYDNAGTLSYLIEETSSQILVITSQASAAGAVFLNENASQVVVPAAAITGTIVFDTREGNDAVTIDFNAGTFGTGIAVNGGTQSAGGTGDSLVITGNATPFALQAVTHAGSDSAGVGTGFDGTIDVDGLMISFTGLEPVTLASSVDTIINLPDGVDNVVTVAGDVVAGEIHVTGATFEDTFVPNPTGSLTINGGNQADSISVGGINPTGTLPANLIAGSLIIDGGMGNDRVDFNGSVQLVSGESLFVTAEEVIVNGSTSLTTSGTGTIDFTTDDIGVSLTANLISSDIIAIRTQSVGRVITLGREGIETLGLSDLELDRLAASSVQIGGTDSGAIIVSAALTPGYSGAPSAATGYDLLLTTGGGARLIAPVTMAVDRDFSLLSTSTADAVVLLTPDSDIATSGSGAILIDAARNVQMSSGSSLVTVDGGIEVLARGNGGSPFDGISVSGALIETQGSGDIRLTGQGGFSGPSISGGNDGIGVNGASQIRSVSSAANAGQIVMNGSGGTGGGNNVGVVIDNAGTLITSVNGNIGISGRGTDVNTPFNYGIIVRTAVISSTGIGSDAASVTLNGTASSGTSDNFGIFFIGNSFLGTTAAVRSIDGDIIVTGQGGAVTSNDVGVYFFGVDGLVSTGSGSITVTGRSGNTAASGILLSNSGITTAAGTGDVLLSAGR
ncbi:MAG: hypothetical protein KDA89_04975, partial [Planctomycetaceae bacterium]|nr:hypothetical protein [Planctomycetaceae bacterium]